MLLLASSICSQNVSEISSSIQSTMMLYHTVLNLFLVGDSTLKIHIKLELLELVTPRKYVSMSALKLT